MRMRPGIARLCSWVQVGIAVFTCPVALAVGLIAGVIFRSWEAGMYGGIGTLATAGFAGALFVPIAGLSSAGPGAASGGREREPEGQRLGD